VAQVIYNAGNGTVTGTPPADTNNYSSGNPVTVAQNDPTTQPHSQASGVTTGNLSRAGATFLYWADGTGTIYGTPNPNWYTPALSGTFNFPNQAGNLTLYAQWAVTTGLTNGGKTTNGNYQFSYDESLAGPGGPEPARTETMVSNGDTDFAWMQQQFTDPATGKAVDITKPPGNKTLPLPVYVTALPGTSASWFPIQLNPGPTGSANSMRSLIVAEVVEIFMQAQNKGWGFTAAAGNEESCGEGLSLFLTVQHQIAVLQETSGFFNTGSSDSWLNSSLPASNPSSTEYSGKAPGFSGNFHYGARLDYVNAIEPWPGNGPATGCSLLFIYYLYHQLGFTIPAIIAAAPGLDSNNNPKGGSCLRGVYTKLTNDTSDPFPFFAGLLATAYPPNQVASIPGPNTDDPWPIGQLSFVGGKNTWGPDEVNDIINQGGTFTDGIILLLTGFNQNVVGSAKPVNPTIAFGGVTSAPSLQPPPNVIYESPNNPTVPQQIQFTYDIAFAKQQLGAFPPVGQPPTPAAVQSQITVLGQAFPATYEFLFLSGADPYFTNVAPSTSNPPQLNKPWFSQDLRVFTATPGAPGGQTPVPGVAPFVENSTGVGDYDTQSAYQYLERLLIHLNQAYGDPSQKDPFDASNNIIPGQQTEFNADSSVTPWSLVGFNVYNNYSFAIARVRLKGSLGSAAQGVKVFFRLWGTQTADTAWDPTNTYPSQNDSNSNPEYPKAPSDDHTIPFFATTAVYGATNFADATDPEFKVGGFTGTGANNQTITIQQGDSQWAYFGCYLNVNDPSVSVNNVKVPLAFPGTHHCLVAQIAYSGSPIEIVNGVVPSPEAGGQLAQRNLQVTTSDNPGPPSAHRVPQTFDVKPSGPPPATGWFVGQPDELMILWGDTPPGSTARIYWPAVSADAVISLASWMYGVHPLTAADAHTIEMTTIDGATYVPIPQGTGPWFAGLFTIDLPQTVTTGQEFDIVVRRIGKRLRPAAPPSPPPPPPPPVTQVVRAREAAGGGIELPEPAPVAARAAALTVTSAAREVEYERYIVGSFQIKIPVSTAAAMLPAEETTLAILKARLEAMPTTNRWYPVLLRYIEQVSQRVNSLGGNASSVPPSLVGYLPGRHGVREDVAEYAGKVCEVAFDCFGDFSGFVLEDCHGRRAFESRERHIGELVLKALRERLNLTVLVSETRPHRIVGLVVKE
jgi:hypothetical protein